MVSREIDTISVEDRVDPTRDQCVAATLELVTPPGRSSRAEHSARASLNCDRELRASTRRATCDRRAPTGAGRAHGTAPYAAGTNGRSFTEVDRAHEVVVEREQSRSGLNLDHGVRRTFNPDVAATPARRAHARAHHPSGASSSVISAVVAQVGFTSGESIEHAPRLTPVIKTTICTRTTLDGRLGMRGVNSADPGTQSHSSV
jgi:hypothetical protein